MKIKAFYLLLLLPLFLCVFGYQSNNETDKIYWNNSRKLTWEDFKGIPILESPHGAGTACGLDYKNELRNDSVVFFAKCFFQIKESWVKEKDKTDKLLAHEQLHFDIAEIFARKFRKELSKYSHSKKNVNALFKSMASKYGKQKGIMQCQYDKETKNSQMESKQIEWEIKIEKELKELKEFEASIVKVKLKK